MNIKKLKPAWIEEFKAFALKGNVLDLAIGVIIGGAFGKIVTSLVNDIIMPAVSMLIPQGNLAEMAWQGIKYGSFLQTIVDFLIISLSIFFAIQLICKLRVKEKEEPTKTLDEPAPTPEEILLLREIRDTLKNQQ